jgi:hypothetical protein
LHPIKIPIAAGLTWFKVRPKPSKQNKNQELILTLEQLHMVMVKFEATTYPQV